MGMVGMRKTVMEAAWAGAAEGRATVGAWDPMAEVRAMTAEWSGATAIAGHALSELSLRE